MAVFGRLDVFYPDGHIETYALDGETVSVGRAEGNTVALDTETISRYHFSITHKDGVVHLTDLDSANGTYIDGTQLNSNDPYLLDDVEEIQIGHLRIIYHPGSDSPTIPVAPTDDATQPSDAGFRVSLEVSQIDVWPASSSSVEIAVTNSKDEEIQYQIVATGLPDGWAKINRPQMLIDGLDTTYVLLNIKPSRRSDTPPKDYPVAIRVSPTQEPDNYIELILMVSLKGFGGFGVALSPEVIQSDDDVNLYMLNQGNEPLTLSITGYDPTQQLRYELPQGDVTLTPGQRTQFTGKIQPQKRPLVGKAHDLPFALVVKAHTESGYQAAVPGTIHVEPSLTGWMLGTIVGILIAIMLVALTLLSQTPEPQIQSFNVASTQVEQGVTVDLNWVASDANMYRIEVDRVPIADLSGDATSYTLNTEEYTDPIDVALIAVNGELTAIAQRKIEVYEPVVINSFETDRIEMIRNVSSTLIVSWNISGAVSTSLDVPEGFSRTNPNTSYDTVDNEVFIGVPQSDFSLILSAEDELGNQTQQTIDITTTDPECTPIQDKLLFEGPDSQFTQTELAVANVPVIVLGIDPSKAWLKVEVANGNEGWGFNESFECDGFDPTELAVIADIPELPTLMPTLPSTPTNIPTQTPTASLTPTQTSSPSPTVTLSDSVTPSPSPTARVNRLREILFGTESR